MDFGLLHFTNVDWLGPHEAGYGNMWEGYVTIPPAGAWRAELVVKEQTSGKAHKIYCNINLAGLTNHLSAQEIVEQMRGLNMQWTEPRMDDGRINPEEQQREEIIQELRSVGKEAIPALIHVLGDSDVQMRRNAALVMIWLAGGYDGQAKMDIREAVPALIKATEDKDNDVSSAAMNSTG